MVLAGTMKRTRKTAVALREFAMTFPGAHEDHPWGELVVKVKGKVFVFLGRDEKLDEELGMAVKLPESAPMVLDQPWAEPTGYGLGKSGWVSLAMKASELPPIEMLRYWIEESYRAVAPKKLIAELDGEALPSKPARPAPRKKKAKSRRRGSGSR